MLKQLHIEHVAVIDTAEVYMTPGFNVLTGETGAGKSLIVESINMVTGERTSHDVIPTGEKKSSVQALFEVTHPNIIAALSDEGISAEDGEVLLFREIYADGRNLCRINGNLSTVAQLRRVGHLLLDVHGQQDGQALLNKESHLYFLDAFSSEEVREKKATYQEKYARYSEIRKELDELSQTDRNKTERIELLRFQTEEIERFDPWNIDEEKLRNEQSVLKNAEKLKKILHEVSAALSNANDFTPATEILSGVSRNLKLAAAIDENLTGFSQETDDLMYRLEDLSSSLSRYEDSVSMDEERLNEISEVLDELFKLKRKYGASVEEICAYYDAVQKELDSIGFSEDKIRRLREEKDDLFNELTKDAETLTALRKTAARALEDAIMRELSDLNMPNVRFLVDFSTREPGTDGCDGVEFLLSTVPTEPPKPLTRIASGGEMSRIMLAMKTVLSEGDMAETLIFDEIDSGVSGRAATRIAEKMRCLSRKKQVLCITHLPQISAAADSHFLVQKDLEAYRTDVLLLSEEERIEELSRLMGGDMPAESIREGAARLRAVYKDL